MDKGDEQKIQISNFHGSGDTRGNDSVSLHFWL